MARFPEKKRRKNLRHWSTVAMICVLLLLAGCAREHLTLERTLDTPMHHASNGFIFLDLDRVEEAQREFQSALRLDSSSARALCGLGLVAGKRKNFSGAFQSMELAKKYAKTDEERAMIAVGEMRLHTMKKGKDWVGRVKEEFEQALENVPDWPEAYFYLGVARTQAYRFVDAATAFRKVIDLHSRMRWQAERALRTVEKIISARPGSNAGKDIALRNAVNRADVAALLVEELKLNELYRDMALHEKSSPLIPGVRRKTERSALPVDVTANPLKDDISVVLELGIPGMECLPDGSFEPEREVTRAEYAVIMGHILTSIRHDAAVNDRVRGRTSPFSDVGNEEPFFTAVMLCTAETAIMGPREGIFNPAGTVSGADALLGLRKLKEALGLF